MIAFLTLLLKILCIQGKVPKFKYSSQTGSRNHVQLKFYNDAETWGGAADTQDGDHTTISEL